MNHLLQLGALLRRLGPGSGLSAALALAATFVAQLQGGPQMLYALFFGITFNYLSADAKTKPGIEFCARQVLRLGVGLLGARITAAQIVALGWGTALTVIAAVLSTIAVALWLGRRLGLDRALSTLSGGAVAICGASAALAITAVLPRRAQQERETLMVVIAVTVLSTVAMVLYPLIARGLALPPEAAGLFLGGTIHDVAQVVGAGYTLGPATGDVATVVKLFRVAMLAAVVLAVSIAFRAEREAAAAAPTDGAPAAPAPPLMPWFLWLFIVLVVVNSLGWLPAVVQNGLGWASRAGLVVAIVALGMKTSLGQLAEAGWRPVALIVAETVWMAGLVLGVIVVWGGPGR